MSTTRPFEEQILAPAEAVLAATLEAVETHKRAEVRLQVLEASAALLGGFDRAWYHALVVGGAAPIADIAERKADALVHQIGLLPIHHALVLAALARPELSHPERRASGVYYTDFRLAQYLASPLRSLGSHAPKVLDPACGSGILLVAAMLALEHTHARSLSSLVAGCACGADLSSSALRGAALALASLTSDPVAIAGMLQHLRQADSLVEGSLWEDVAPDGFDVVIGNPPWEKLKLSRHEMLRAAGAERHYGAEYATDHLPEELDEARETLVAYVAQLNGRYQLQGRGERDLYQYFLELSLGLTRRGGRALLLIPAGLIRSLGTKGLRDYLLRHCSEVEFTVLDNRARFFAIDTRFKFLALDAQPAVNNGHSPVRLTTATGQPLGVTPGATIHMQRSWLFDARPDLSLPEVRSEEEWRIFRDITAKGQRLGAPDGPWQPTVMREADMTRDRGKFHREKRPGLLPLLEGRMVHQYRHGAKRYVAGTGRRATWLPMPRNASCEIEPQFWCPLGQLPESVQARVAQSRIGFCDITGQTNERTMLAARVPAQVVCGNKVPTILFAGQRPRAVADCWLAIANSFCLDWMLRRVVTTTVNYFLLLDLPLPLFDPMDRCGIQLGQLACLLGACRHEGSARATMARRDRWHEAELRAEIDWRVLHLYGLGVRSLAVMLADFPLLDRSQPPIPGEERSTVTRDFLLLRAAEALGDANASHIARWRDRVEAARAVGAVPFVPSHLDLAE